MSYYLRPNVQIEPLVNKWHAYPFLIAPQAAAMVIKNYQLSTMKSYLQMPMAHVAALKNPDMVGGPFIDYGGKRLEEIRALKKQIEDDCSDLLKFAESINELRKILAVKGKGYPLEVLYEEIPEPLRGYVELVYDLEHRPSFRFIERLLYNSEYYKNESQSISLRTIQSDSRPFIFSTPRLPDAGIVQFPFPFDDERVDYLSRLKETPQNIDDIIKVLSVPEESVSDFMEFLTKEAPKKQKPFDGDGVRVRYFGHACVLIETAEVSILTDPLISYRYDSEITRYTYEDLPDKIDYAIITHAHHDHIVIETLVQLRHKIRNVIVPRSGSGYLQDPSMKLILENIGFKSVIELDELQHVEDRECKITALPFFGEHCDLNIRSKAVYHIKAKGKSIIAAADSSCLNPDVYTNVKKLVGDINILFIGLECTGAPMSWSYGPFFAEQVEHKLDQVRRSKGSNCKLALALIDIFHPKEVYLYAMGSEPWLNYFMALQHSHSENTGMEIEKIISESQSRGVTTKSLFASHQFVC